MDSPPGFPGKPGVGVMVVAEGGKFICGHGGEVLLAVDNEGKTIREFQQPDKRFAYAWRRAIISCGTVGSRPSARAIRPT